MEKINEIKSTESTESTDSNNYLETVITGTVGTFDCLVIKHGSLGDISWSEPNYIDKLMELDLFKIIKTNSDNFIEVITTNLDIDKYKIDNLSVKSQIIGEEPYYLYEMQYIDLENESKYIKDENNIKELATLLNINGEKIYSDVIIFKSHIPSLTDNMSLCTITKKDLGRILYDRAYTTIVLGDGDDLTEDKVAGDITQYAENFFENEKFEKIELSFLLHNINIWYSVFDYGDKICGNLINKRIDRCIWFSMKSDKYRCNLSLDEVKKIISLSKVLTDYKTPDKLTDERIDNYGRKIVNNKYKVLDWVYNESNKISNIN